MNQQPDGDDEFRPARAATGPDAKPIPPLYTNVIDFVERRMLRIYIRQGDGEHRRWCAEWWRHPEAVLRMFALWRAYETHRQSQDGNALSLWWLNHADKHMAALMSVEGPFGLCSIRGGHRDGRKKGNPEYGIAPLPAVPADRDAFDGLDPWGGGDTATTTAA